ncbi:TIGR01777 family protein [Mucilaginibacter mali]|uniref:TIGR01777 family protein n=1 Tax=Mucilaginibacter mali TaxID=2740462 RepID=A0A7D4UGR8_9SPHI|nr:TIGR01777 family oxidoreductase [Mucilaginibacter mali]QKJ32176.1 TIGR01777 family protein [Mucilaginibacter mali]
MKYQKIVLAGGNGYLGTVLAEHFKTLAAEIIILARRPVSPKGNIKTVVWDGKTAGDWVAQLTGADLLVNLCGKNVNCRYTEKNKQEIFDSRLIPTALLNRVVTEMENPPRIWINSSSATIYRHAEDRPQDELTGDIGEGFSVEVCKAWEHTFFETELPATRKIALRIGIVLGKESAVFPRLYNLVKFGLGGKQGDGEQYVNWIYEQDVARAVEWLLDNPEANGAFNCVAPNPVKNADMMRVIRKACGMPIGLPAPKWLLEVGAAIIGTETELILKSRWVMPQRLLDAGFEFRYPNVEDAIINCLK